MSEFAPEHIEGWERCPDCEGEGLVLSEGEWKDCPTCDGIGEIAE